MLKLISKKMVLTLVLSLLVTLFAGTGTANAFAEYSASHIPLVSTDSVESLGTVIIKFYNLPACSDPAGFNQDHQFIVKLPADYEINDVSAQVITPGDSSVEAHIISRNDNQFLVEVYNEDLTGEVKCAISIRTYIPSSAQEAVSASIISQPGSVFADGMVQVAKTEFGLVTVEADPVEITPSGGTAVVYFRENQANALREGANCLTLKLPQGFTWVQPVKGDFTTMDTSYSGKNDFNIEKTDARTLRFDRYGSADQAYIWKLTAAIEIDETAAAEGDIKLTLDGTSSIQPKTIVLGDYAENEEIVDPPSEPSQPGRFIIGAKTYYIGSQTFLMDSVPYIKNSRTYVPMRYLGEILGAEVVWDADAQTVTLTRGDVTVIFTVGSTTYTVNGKVKNMDVAPEITGDRTMLPARYPAEAFEAIVTWEASTQTVLIQR